VPGTRERVDHLAAEALPVHPERRIEPAQIDGHRVGPQRLAAPLHILREKGDAELPQRAVDRIAISEEGTVALGDRTPVAAVAEQGHDMVDIPAVGPHVHQQRRLTRQPKGRGRHECGLDAVGPVLPQHRRDRHRRRAVWLMIPGDAIDEILDSLGGSQARQKERVGIGKPEPPAQPQHRSPVAGTAFACRRFAADSAAQNSRCSGCGL